jgi:hypothetical protein
MIMKLTRHLANGRAKAAYFLVLNFVIIVVVAMTGCTNNVEEDVSGIQAMYVMNARDLYDEYSANEVAADMKYAGQVVLVKGWVQTISKDILDDPYIVVSDGSIIGVQCYFNKNRQAELAVLSRGQEIVVRCRVDKKLMNVIAKNSIVVAKGSVDFRF